MSLAIKINRAPVLTLWAAVVAERLGFDHEVALTLGKAVAPHRQSGCSERSRLEWERGLKSGSARLIASLPHCVQVTAPGK